MSLSKQLKDICDKSICLYAKSEIETALNRMALEMHSKLADSNPIFLCVLLGGIVPLGNLLPFLNFQLEINYIHFSSYDAKNNMGELVLKAEPTIDLADRTVVVVDDILDTGTTLKAAIKYCQSHGTRKVYTAVLLDKAKTRRENGIKSADFSALAIDDRFVFGYGLDYSGYLRNLPGIYALEKDSSK